MARRARPTIREDHHLLQQLLRRERDSDRKRRLHMLVLFSSAMPPTRKQVAAHLAVSRDTITRWLAAYDAGGIEQLLTNRKSGAKPGQRLLPQDAFAALEHRLRNEGGFNNYVELKQWLEKEFGLHINYKSLYDLVRYRLKINLAQLKKDGRKNGGIESGGTS